MAGRTSDYVYLEPEIFNIIKESDTPLSALGVNFRVNDKLDKIIELNTVKRHLNVLVKNNKIIQKTKNDTTYYQINSRNKSN